MVNSQVLEDRSVALPSSDRPPALFNRSVVLVVDALKYEFAAETDGAANKEEAYYRCDDNASVV